MMWRSIGGEGMHIALIQEPWIFKGRIRISLPEGVASLHYINAGRNRAGILDLFSHTSSTTVSLKYSRRKSAPPSLDVA